MVAMFFLPFAVQAQDAAPTLYSYTLKGVLLDSLTNEGEPYATLRITPKVQPQVVVKMAVTDGNGKFQEQLKTAEGDYLLVLSSVGKTVVTKEYTVNANANSIDLGTIFTQEAVELLGGVEVIAQRPLVKVDIDKIEYNVEDDPDSKTNNVLDMLRKVPLVTVDGEDNIQVNGSGSFKIHVNGKPNNMMSNNPKDVLKSMPANSIKYIEVITEPGAKYDAEGVGGILNIVTIGGGGMQGYTATFGANVNEYGVGANAYATVQIKKFTITGNYNYNNRFGTKNSNSSYRESYKSDEYKYLNTEGESEMEGLFQYGNLEGSYEIDTLRLITFSAGMYGNSFNNDGYSSIRMQNADYDPVYSYGMIRQSKSNYQYIGASLDYQRSFKKKGELLTFSYRLNNNPQDTESSSDYVNVIDYPYENLRDYTSKNDANTIEHTFQTDYVNPLTKMHELEVGAKYIIRNSHSDSKHYNVDKSGMNSVLDPSLSNKFDHLQDILAAYAGYRLRYKKIGARVGVRYEHTFLDVNYQDATGQDFDAGFDDVVPSVNLSYQLSPMRTIKASYNMRISRPGIWYLNPYVNRTNPDIISYGNPDLDSEKGHSFGLNFSSFSQTINLNIGLRHSFVNNSIESYSFVGLDEETGRENVEQQTYRNYGKTSDTRLSLYFNWNIGPKTRFYVNGSGSYHDFNSKDETLKNDGFGYNAHVGLQHTLPWNLRLSLNGGGSGSSATSQGKRSGYHYYGVGLNRLFLKDRLTVALNASSFLKKNRSYSSEITKNPDYYSRSKGTYPARYLSVSVSYRIGELKASVKKAARSIQNDDVKSGDSGNTGSGQN